ncbi:transcription factor SPT20 homolog isoform X2 [Sitodiplosis mosellana]|uniref:transcription factor SPT20 homolog isoform X2 n=1 Tax=Sitodiplosis mosellana TaxID=263140 RepID=UPI0024439F49|nr:transcription factor SPT20 homolog isoform X2 [Sitodiplosis mosellana]XP_055319762.1 transcription factor SPT20 homolog isoform X2 [Sitodiplosis mosellana]XP_055319763.1 transcription factor SPT20 homolog isoform X2 [Sitodiplosis mosellana]XP_055319764.1 transcription factor SPT20 homolog isoform X2 [Sitodiplosis mosellana]
MQSLELSCQESDFKLNDALNKIKGHRTSTATETTTTLTTRLPSNTQHQNRHPTFNSIQHVQNVHNSSSNESNSTMTTHSTSAATITSHSRTNNNSTDRLSASKQTSPSTASSSTHDGGGGGGGGVGGNGTDGITNLTSEKQSPSNTSMSGSTSDSSFFDIHEKLRELYVYLYLKDIQDTQVDNRIKLKSRSFVLETLVARENLNTVILNLYPGNKGYSLAFRQEYLPQNKKYDGLHSIFNRSLTKSQLCGATELNSVNCVRQEKEEHLLETVRWPYENGDLLESVNNEELPILYMKLLLSYAPNAFYSGCVIVEVRDYRQSFPISACCDNYYVLLKPTTQTLLADVKVLSNEEDFTHEDRVALESNMVLATAAPLCLDPSPKVARKAFYSQHKRQMWNTFAIRRQMRKFSQVAINRKRKTDQFTHTQGLDLSDYLFRARQRPRHLLSQSFDSSIGSTWKIPRKASDVMKPIRTPNLDLPTTLKPPSSVNVEQLARAYDKPRETKDCMPILIEEYILETDRGHNRVYHIKLSIYQRPTNSEYLGELYVDRDYQKNSRNGEACQFSLGTRAHANRYIQQFTEIFTEEGRKSVKITHIVPGHAPKVSYTTGMVESLPLPTQQKGQQPPTQQQPSLAAVASSSSQQQQQQTSTTNSQSQPQTTAPQSQINSQQKVAITLKSPTTTHGIPVASEVPGLPGSSQNQPTHLKIANGSVVVVQEQSSGNISRVATITSQQAQNQTNSPSQQGIVTNNLPLLAQISNKTAPQTLTTASGSSNDINTLMTSIIQSPTHSLQNQAGTTPTHKSNSNAAIISLLNSAPAAMTSSAVVNTLNTPSNSPVTIPIQRLIATHTTNNTDNLQQSQQAQTQTVLLNQDQQANVRVTMSALASQLASPPALMSSSPINPSTFNFAQLKSHQVQQVSAQPQQQLLMNNNNKIRRDSLAAPSPGSDSNASSASSSNLGNFSITPGFPFIGSASPTTSIISNECSSGSIERVPSADKSFLEVSMCGPSSLSSGSSFMTPSPKNNVTAIASPLSSPTHQQQQQQQVDSPSSVSSTSAFQIRKQNIVTATSNDATNQNQSNQSVAQTTTLNLHGINFSSLQGAMATFPGLQNVQVQIPGLAQPISLSLTGATGNTVASASPHQLESMPVSLGQTTQTVVLTTASQQGQGSVLSLPIAQLVAASNVKNLSPQQLRNVNVNLGATQTNQPQQTHPHMQQQRPRSVPTIATSTINAKQLAARGLITSQRNIAVAPNTAQMKITTPITMASVPHATASTLGAVNNNPMLVQLQLQKHHQTQQFHHQNQHQ